MPVSCSVFVATSIDGYIARPDGSLDWLDRARETMSPGEDCGFGDFLASVDAVVLGRRTFEKVLSFPDWPYESKPVWVLSESLEEPPAGRWESVRILSKPPADVVRLAENYHFDRLYIDGGRAIQSFLSARLITDLTITTIPILLGSGLPLFGPTSGDVRLSHVFTRVYDFGFVQNRYAVLSA
ncbi:dihydrofolate reductase family protein [Aquisphaera insulae]|uniref:dihydrofolate reductase family protein n=1 Tax=Aquisphaera insulae TaxID=2712864 RepID=UPI0013ED672E|nr:dihydrofolate reductase family protein [Aquisphaera insulae]